MLSAVRVLHDTHSILVDDNDMFGGILGGTLGQNSDLSDTDNRHNDNNRVLSGESRSSSKSDSSKNGRRRIDDEEHSAEHSLEHSAEHSSGPLISLSSAVTLVSRKQQ